MMTGLPSIRTRRETLLADAALLTVAIGWGLNFVVIRYTIDRMDPMVYLLLRHIVATLLLVAIMPRSVTQSHRRDWLYGGILGVFLFVAFALQTIGLQYTTPGKSSFITGMNVAVVPFLYMAVARRSPGRWQILGALVATLGLGVMSLQAGFTISKGDALTVIAMLGFAAQITATGFFAPRTRPATLAVTQIAVAGLLFLIVTPLLQDPWTEAFSLDLSWQIWACILWTAAMGTVYAFIVQASSQRHTTSTHAAVILCLESVFGAFFSVLFGYETITGRLLGGAALIFAGILIIELLPSASGPLLPAGAMAALETDTGDETDESDRRSSSKGDA